MADQQMRNGVFNSSFLVLNLGTNTLGLGNSFTIPPSSKPSHQISVDKNNANVDIDTISSSMEEESEEGSSSSDSHNTIRVPEEKEDPDWVPEKTPGRSNSNTSCRNAKPNEGTSISSSSSRISVLAGVSGMLPSISSKSDILPPKGLSGNLNSGTPPHHLMELLRFFGWKVVFQTGNGGYVYISPTGIAYSSLPQAFATFLHGTSKYNEKGSISSCYLENSAPSGSPLHKASPSGSNTGLVCGNSAADTGKRKRGRKKRTCTLTENEHPKESDEPVWENDGSLGDYGKTSLAMTKSMVPKEASRVVSLGMVNEQTRSNDNKGLGNELKQMDCNNGLANNEMLLLGKLPKAKRSLRTRARHVPAVNKNILSGYEVNKDKLKDKKKISATSGAETGQEKSGDCQLDVGFDNGVKKSDCSNMGVNRGNQSKICVDKDKIFVGLRRSGRLSKNNDLTDVGFVVQKGVGDSYLDKGKSPFSMDVRKDERKPLTSDSTTKDIQSNINIQSLHSETQRLNSSSAVLSNESNIHSSRGYRDDTIGIRRSMRINGKRVPVDDDSDIEFVFDDYFLDPAGFGANIMAIKDREKLISSCFQVENKENGNPVTDNMHLKQTNIYNPDYPNFGCKKVSASLKGIGVGIPAPEKFFKSFAATRFPADGGQYTSGNKKIKRRGGCGLTVRRKDKDDHQEETTSQAKISMLSWLIDCGTLTENEKVYYITKNNTGDTFTGFITRGGIWCYCCMKVLPLLKFIVHAGCSIQQPWDNIFLLSGKTLLVCIIEAWENEKEKEKGKVGFQTVGVGDPDPSDDTCGICADGGQLICCDGCPSTFHQKCMMLKTLPEGSWYCPYCSCKFCMSVLRGPNMPLMSPILPSCRQCGQKYHQECAHGNGMHLIGQMSYSFCGEDCKKVDTRLSEMLGIRNPMEGGFSWTLLKRFDEDGAFTSNRSLAFVMECNIKLSMALSVLNECFVPLVDPRTGLDMIFQAVYNCGSNFSRLNYEGFYTLILEEEEELISAASLRIHGTSLAEMPFIGTRPMYRKQGMCRRLVNAVENMLSFLHVEKLFIPAIPDLLKTWITAFGFKPLEPLQKNEIKHLSMMIFAGTTLLQKSICSSTRSLLQKDVSACNDLNQRENIEELHELPRALGNGQIHEGGHLPGGGSDWWFNLNEQRDTTRMAGCSSIAFDPSTILPPISNGSIREANPLQNTFTMNHGTTFPVTSFFPSVNVVLDQDPLGAGTSIAPSNHTNRWFQGAKETKDLQIDAISSSLSFDSLIRISS